MKATHRIFPLILLLFTAGLIASAQDLSFKGRSEIELGLGRWGGAKASNPVSLWGVRSEAAISGFTGSLKYAYWLREHLSVTLAVSLFCLPRRGPPLVCQPLPTRHAFQAWCHCGV